MNSADAWHDSNADPDNLEALLGLSVELVSTMNEATEAAKQRHPSGKVVVETPAPLTIPMVQLNALDRCDQGCGAAALYRVGQPAKGMELDFCHHHHNKIYPVLEPDGWSVIGSNSSLYEELYNSNRLKGGDHA